MSETTKSMATGGLSRAGGLALMAAGILMLLGAAKPVGEPDLVRWLGQMRHIAVHVPTSAPSGSPLLLVMSDPRRGARYALANWRELAEREGVVVAAVSSEQPGVWRVPRDGPGFLRAVVQRVRTRRAIDPSRVYLFGTGVGGGFAVSMGLLQPQYFAAVASFGGNLEPGMLIKVDRLERPLPVHIYFSKRTPQFPVDALRQTAAAMRETGAEVEVERLDVGPDFQRRGSKVAGQIWADLASHALSEAPRYQPTRYDR